MAIYHCSANIISRSSGRSSVGASAYRSGEKITNEYDGLTHDYRNKSGVVHSEIMLSENAPERFHDRATLWNEVEAIEKGKTAQLSREIQVALPVELKLDEQIKLIQSYVKKNFVEKGMCADINIHDKNDGNPHAHIMLTVRDIDEKGEWKSKQKKEYILDKDGNKQYDKKKKTYKCKTVKTTDWDSKEKLLEWRENWAKEVNISLEKNFSVERIDHRSYKEQGIKKIPSIHLGPQVNAMEKKGIETYKGNVNQKIASANKELQQLLDSQKENQIKKEKFNQEIEKKFQELERREAPRVSEERREAPRVSEERKTLNSEDRAKNLYKKEQSYLSIKKQQIQLQNHQQKAEIAKERLSKRAENLPKEYQQIQKMANDFNKINDSIKELEKNRTFFKTNRKEISLKIEESNDLKKSYISAKEKFQKKWGIAPKQKLVEEKTQRIKLSEQEGVEYLEQTKKQLATMEVQKKQALLKYQTELVVTETLPDKKEIMDKFEKLQLAEKNKGKLSTIEQLERHKLKIIDPSKKLEISKLLEKANPDLATKVLKTVVKKAVPERERER